MTKEFNAKDKECVKLSMQKDELTKENDKLTNDLKSSKGRLERFEKDCQQGKVNQEKLSGKIENLELAKQAL